MRPLEGLKETLILCEICLTRHRALSQITIVRLRVAICRVLENSIRHP